MRFKICFILLLSFLTMWSQNDKDHAHELKEIAKDTTLFETYTGKKSYRTINFDSISNVKHGVFNFLSEINQDYFSLDRLIIEGNYNEEKKEGKWIFIKQDIDLEINELQLDEKDKSANLNSQLSGIQNVYQFNYKNNLPEDEWLIERTNIDASTFTKMILGQVRFEDGIPVGKFVFETGDEYNSIVQGNLNKEGFLDKELVLSYFEEGEEIREIRNYYDGFLLDVIRLRGEEVIDSVAYEKTSSKIEKIKQGEDEEFEFSKRGFGIMYDTGLKSKSELNIQLKGNKIITKFIDELNKYHLIDGRDTLQFNFTRRFKINYSEESEKEFQELAVNHKKSFDSIANFVKSPSVILNKDKSKNLTEKYQQTRLYHRKLRIIDSVVSKQEKKFFDFVNREKFVMNLLDTINLNKKIVYEFDSEKDSVQLNLNFVFEDKDKSAVGKLFVLQDSLANASLANISSTYKEFKQFAQKETIDSLDQVIYQLNFERDSIFLSNKKTDGKFDDRELSTNIFMAYSKNILNPIYQNYINTDDFENKMSIGKELIEFNKSIIKNKPKVDRFDKFVQHTDSLFTIYRDNPFDYRKSEVKIYPNINRKSKEVLFPHYVNSLLEAGKHKDFIKYLERLYALDEKLLEFVKKNDEDVQRIDRAVRRENVPQRIERIYGLQ